MATEQPGFFLVCEGGEGSGKSTLAAALARRLGATGREVVLTHEPGGTPIGDRVRELLHHPMTPWAEAFAFLLARAELVALVIRPALERGAVVVCDRFTPSTYAYQGRGRDLDLWGLRDANRHGTGGLEPDLVIYLDLDPEVGLARKAGEGAGIRTGAEDLAFHQRVREDYLEQAEYAEPGTWITIDGSATPEAVVDRAWAGLMQALESRVA